MSRGAQLQQVRSAEALLAAGRQRVATQGRARMDSLRRLHPAWLLGGGFLCGALTQRLAERVGGPQTVPAALSRGVRLMRLLPGNPISELLQVNP